MQQTALTLKVILHVSRLLRKRLLWIRYSWLSRNLIFPFLNFQACLLNSSMWFPRKHWKPARQLDTAKLLVFKKSLLPWECKTRVHAPFCFRVAPVSSFYWFLWYVYIMTINCIRKKKTMPIHLKLIQGGHWGFQLLIISKVYSIIEGNFPIAAEEKFFTRRSLNFFVRIITSYWIRDTN